MKILSLVARPRDRSGAPQIVRLAGGGDLDPFHFDGQHHWAGLSPRLRFSAAIGFDENGPTGRTSPASGRLTVHPSTPARLRHLAGLHWPGAAVELVERARGAAPRIRLVGRVAGVEVSGAALLVTLRDQGEQLDRPVLVDRFAGTGGLEGGEEAAGRIRRRSLGHVFGVEARIFLKAWNIHEVGDTGRPLGAIAAVRDKGRAGPVEIVAWQGSAAATLELLKGRAVPKGGALVAPSIACVRWFTQPSGALTVDLRGETADGFADRVATIAARIAAGAGLAVAGVEAIDARRQAAAGLHLDSESETAAAALDRLLYGAWIGWTLAPATGALLLRDFNRPAGALPRVRSIRAGRTRQLPPVAARRVGYRRNQRPHGAGEIAAAISAADVAFDSGETLETVQPGADKTSENVARDTAGIGGRPTPGVIEQIDRTARETADLILAYGDTIAADAAKRAAEAAAEASERARKATAEVRALAEQDARDAAEAERAADGFAVTARGHAESASRRAGDSEAFAELAEGSSRTAGTHAGNARFEAGEALQSKRDAAGSATDASRFSELSASSAGAAGLAMAATFPRTMRAEAFTTAPGLFAAPGLTPARVTADRAIFDTRREAELGYAYGVWTRATLPWTPGRAIRLTARLEWVDGHPDQPSAIFYAFYYDGSGRVIDEGVVGPEFGGLPPNIRTDHSHGLVMGPTVDGSTTRPAFVRYGVLTNRKPGNLGQLTVGRTDVHAFFPDDITSELASANSSRASSSSAETAGVHEGAAGRHAEAARQHVVSAGFSAEGAAGSARASSSSAEAAAAHEGAAGRHAEAARQHVISAGTSVGQAQGFARASEEWAAASEGSAGAARSAARLSASSSGGASNRNSTFADWGDGEALPRHWLMWASGSHPPTRQSGGDAEGSPYGVQLINNGGVETGIYQDIPGGGGDWIATVSAELLDGSPAGAGLLVYLLDQQGSYLGEGHVNFVTDADLAGLGHGHFGVRRWRKLISLPKDPRARIVRVYAMGSWPGFGTGTGYKALRFYRAGLVPASTAETAAGKALADATRALAEVATEGSVRASEVGAVADSVTRVTTRVGGLESTAGIHAQSLATHDGQLATRVRTSAVSPGGRAQVEVFSSSNGGAGVDIVGDTRFRGRLDVNSGLTGARVQITDDSIVVTNGVMMHAIGTGFGENSRFMEWKGPHKASLAQCTRADALGYFEVDGNGYFGGALNAGVITVPVRNTSLAENIGIGTGPFGSNGRARVVTVSIETHAQQIVTGTCPTPERPSVIVDLYRGSNAGGQLIDSRHFAGDFICTPGFGPDEPGGQTETISGSFSVTDNSGGTSAEFFARIRERRTFMAPQAQSLSLISVEQ